MHLLAVVPLGIVVGLTLGALGGGGAILTVPILVYLLGQSAHAATAGSLVIVMVTALVGAVGHQRRGNVRLRDGSVFAAVGVLGSLLGSKLSASVPSAVLLSAFGVLMIAVGVVMLRRRSAQDESGTGHRRGPLVLLVTASAVGFLTGFFGVGGGFAVVPALALALGFPMPVAVGTSLVVIVVNSLVALVARVTVGVQIDWPIVLTFSAFGAIGSLIGGRVASRVEPRHLNRAFGVLLFLVAAYELAMNLPRLIGA